MESATTFNDIPKTALELCIGGAGMMPGAVPNKMCRDHLKEVVENPQVMAAHMMARHESYGEASQLIKESLGVDTIDDEKLMRGKRLAFINAVFKEHTDIVLLLLKSGVDIRDLEDEEGIPVLDHALMSGSVNLATLLHNHGANMAPDDMEMSLGHAIHCDREKVVDWIMARELCHPNILLEKGLIALKACYVSKALEAGAEASFISDYVVEVVAESGRTDIMGLMIDLGVYVDLVAYSMALSKNNAHMINFLSQRGVSIDGVHMFQMTTAVSQGKYDAVVAAVAAGAKHDIWVVNEVLDLAGDSLEDYVGALIRNKFVNFAYLPALRTGNMTVIRMLMEAGWKPFAGFPSDVWWQAFKGRHFEAIKTIAMRFPQTWHTGDVLSERLVNGVCMGITELNKI